MQSDDIVKTPQHRRARHSTPQVSAPFNIDQTRAFNAVATQKMKSYLGLLRGTQHEDPAINRFARTQAPDGLTKERGGCGDPQQELIGFGDLEENGSQRVKEARQIRQSASPQQPWISGRHLNTSLIPVFHCREEK